MSIDFVIHYTFQDNDRKYVIVKNNIATLYLKNIRLTDNGEYQCSVSNEADSVTESATLTVKSKCISDSQFCHIVSSFYSYYSGSPVIISSTLGKVRAIPSKEY